MREIIAQSELAPILNRDRGVIAVRLQELINPWTAMKVVSILCV